MKQFFIFLSLLSLIQLTNTAIVIADTNSERILAQADQLILSEAFFDKQGNKTARAEIQSLSLSNKEFLYDKYQKFDFPLLNSLINGYVPGLGSWLQGDWKGALFMEVGILGSVAACYLTYDMTKSFNQYYGLSITSLSMFILISLIRPFTYARDWNDGLRHFLNYTEVAGIMTVPFSGQICRQDDGFTFNLLALRF
jgi:hypothetical protein